MAAKQLRPGPLETDAGLEFRKTRPGAPDPIDIATPYADQGLAALRVSRLRRHGVSPALAGTMAVHAFGEARA